MGKTIVIIGTIDTKGEQLLYLKDRIEKRGHRATIMDISMGAEPSFRADIGPVEIARLAGLDHKTMITSKDRLAVTNAMTEGAARKALDLLSLGELDGIVAMGGTTIALLGSRVMAGLPFGIPKLIATPAAMAAYVGRWFGATDITVMQMIMEVAGMNGIVANCMSQVAGSICGMVEESAHYTTLTLPYPSVAITQIGFSDQCAKNVERLLVERGYHVYPFHAQGTSDRAMDMLISQGLFDGVVEIVPAGLVEERFRGNRAAGMERLDAALERGIPQVWAPCCLNLTGAGPTRTNRQKYVSSGKVLEIDEIRAMARFPVDELLEGARLYAEKINRAKGPLRLVLPLRGWSSLDREGSLLYDPDSDRLFVEEMKRHLRNGVDIREIDCNLEDIPFAEALVEGLDQFMKESTR